VEDEAAALVSTPTAESLLHKWTKRGWVYRSVSAGSWAERYQLTSGAGQAIRQMHNLQRNTSIATESTLSMVMDSLRQVASEANPNPAARRQLIIVRIDSLAQERDALDRG